MWNERDNKACEVRGDLNILLAGHIIPEFLTAYHSELSEFSAFETRLVPLLHCFKRYTQDALGAPVFVELLFGFHALLISVLALQGDDHVF